MPLNHPANLEGPDVVKHVSFAPSDRFRFIHNDLPQVLPTFRFRYSWLDRFGIRINQIYRQNWSCLRLPVYPWGLGGQLLHTCRMFVISSSLGGSNAVLSMWSSMFLTAPANSLFTSMRISAEDSVLVASMR